MVRWRGTSGAVAMKEEIVGFGPIAAADDIDVASAARDHQTGLAPLRSISVLMAMVEPWIRLSTCRRIETGFANAIDDAFDGIGGCGQTFRVLDGLSPLVEGDQVGEGAADIDRNPQTHSVRFLPKRSAGQITAGGG